MSTKVTPGSEPAFEDEYIAKITQIFEELIVFNRVIGLKIVHIGTDRAHARIAMHNDLVGHFTTGRVHGGVISAALDTTGGLAVMAAIGARHMDETPMQRLMRFAKLGTIDLRVDYLRPALGEVFEVHAEVLRLGSRVASTRMEFRGADGKLFSTGSAAYMVS